MDGVNNQHKEIVNEREATVCRLETGSYPDEKHVNNTKQQSKKNNKIVKMTQVFFLMKKAPVGHCGEECLHRSWSRSVPTDNQW